MLTEAEKAKLDALCAAADTFNNQAAAHCDDHRVIGGVMVAGDKMALKRIPDFQPNVKVSGNG